MQFPLFEAFDESPRQYPVIVIDPCAFVGATVSGSDTNAPGLSITTTAASASTNDEDVVVAAGGSTCTPRLADDDALLLASTAAACRLRRLFDCGDCNAGNCGELAHDEQDARERQGTCMLRWFSLARKDNFRRMMLPSGITLATLGGGAASETNELDCVGSGVSRHTSA